MQDHLKKMDVHKTHTANAICLPMPIQKTDEQEKRPYIFYNNLTSNQPITCYEQIFHLQIGLKPADFVQCNLQEVGQN